MRWGGGTDLVPNVRFKILLPRNIHTNTTILQPLGLDFIINIRDGRDDYVGYSQSVLQRESGR